MKKVVLTLAIAAALGMTNVFAPAKAQDDYSPVFEANRSSVITDVANDDAKADNARHTRSHRKTRSSKRVKRAHRTRPSHRLRRTSRRR